MMSSFYSAKLNFTSIIEWKGIDCPVLFFKAVSHTHMLYFNVGEFDISDAFFPPDKGRETKSFSFLFKSKN